MRTIELNSVQKLLLEDAFKNATNATKIAQEAIEFATAKRKAFDDLLNMYCSVSNLDRTKVNLDPQTWTILYEE